MEIKISVATQEEEKNLFIFLINRYKNESSEYGIEVDEIDEYLSLKKESVSIQKFEIELDGIIKIIFNKISFYADTIPEAELVVEDGKSVVKSTGKISKSVEYRSTFYEFLDGEYTDITNNDFIHFGYLK